MQAPASEQALEKQGGKKPKTSKESEEQGRLDCTSAPEENRELGTTQTRHGVPFRKLAQISCERALCGGKTSEPVQKKIPFFPEHIKELENSL